MTWCRHDSIGRNVQHLVTRPDDKYCFRLHGNIVYYCSEKLMRQSTNIGTDELLSIGTAVGKLTKTKKFHLRITFLDYLAQYAKVRAAVPPH
jgi:60S ribosome subunit biogenesis protein NIP7